MKPRRPGLQAGNEEGLGKKSGPPPLPPPDHSAIAYPAFHKVSPFSRAAAARAPHHAGSPCQNIYQPHDDVTALSYTKIRELRQLLGVRVLGTWALGGLVPLATPV